MVDSSKASSSFPKAISGRRWVQALSVLTVIAVVSLGVKQRFSKDSASPLRKLQTLGNLNDYTISSNLPDYPGGDTSSLAGDYGCGAEGSPVLLEGGGAIALRRAEFDSVCALVEQAENGRTLARSYHGGTWEARVPLAATYSQATALEDFVQVLSCEDTACILKLPEGDYELVAFRQSAFQGVQAVQREDDQTNQNARFLIQATFGPTMAALESLSSMSYEEWIQDQIDLPISSHREFLRERFNFYLVDGNNIGKPPRPEKVCAYDSRWDDVAFGYADQGKQVEQYVEGENIVFKIDGIVRTEIPIGWFSDKGEIIDVNGLNVCIASRYGSMRFCSPTVHRRMTKPVRLRFVNHPPTGNTVTFSDSCAFPNMAHEHGAVSLFNGTNDNCQCTLPQDNKVFFRQDKAGKWWRFSDMTAYKQNTLDEPDLTTCISAPHNHLNLDKCVVVPGTCGSGPYDDLLTHHRTDNGGYSLACGSPGEVPGNPRLGGVFKDTKVYWPIDYDFSVVGDEAKTAWIQIAQNAADQLRQRIAFCLSEIWVADLYRSHYKDPLLHFYDIFVRNAFGNYFDIMREVSFSNPMAEYLTYMNKASFAYSGYAADENYGREIMQVFTIGPVKLHLNATVMVDDQGKPIPTYDRDDVETMARVWTGFEKRAGRRTNKKNGHYSDMVDHPNIDPVKHDQFPKRNLDNGYIGDGYPLCYELPHQDFLHKGAIYEFYQPFMDVYRNSQGNKGLADITITLAQNSSLYTALCNNKDGEASCNFQSRFTLTSNLACGDLCDRPTLDYVKVGTAVYRYVGRPCTTFPFFNNGTDTKFSRKHPNESKDQNIESRYCLDPKWKTSCCGESMRDLDWSDDECSPKAKIFADGKVAIYHDVEENPVEYNTEDYNKANINSFRVVWDDNSTASLPTPGKCGPCEDNGDACICSVQEVRKPVFDSAPSREAILAQMHVGSVPPNSFDAGEYVLHSVERDGVTIFRRATGTAFDTDTIMAVAHVPGTGRQESLYFKNVVSHVQITGAPHLQFRNPPMFNQVIRNFNTEHHANPMPADTIGAYREVDAVLEYLLWHPNTAPFVAYRFIQRFTTSNPSAGYIEQVAKAFQSGRYGNFGTGERGDLAATIAAILLNSEARAVVLDGDPTQGLLREPLLKLIHILRSTEAKQHPDEWNDRFLNFPDDVKDYINQMPYEPPSVFSFFLPDFSRPGSVMERQGLVAPESQVLWHGSFFLFFKLLNNLMGQWVYGLMDTATTADEQIKALNTLLAGGRISDEKIQLMRDISAQRRLIEVRNQDIGEFRRTAKAFLMFPEFHATNVNNNIANPIAPPALQLMPSPANEFKAVVFVDLMGGADSMQMLIPHSGCKGDDLYESYKATRHVAALPKENLLQIEVPEGQQNCTTFGMHPSMDKLHQLYLDKDLTWVANVGNLHSPGKGAPGGGDHVASQRDVQRGYADARQVMGVLGRAADALSDSGYRTQSYYTSGWGDTLAGTPGRSPEREKVETYGMTPLVDSFAAYYNVTELGSSVFAQYYRHQLQKGLDNGERINRAVREADIDPNLFQNGDSVVQQLKTVAKLIQQRDLIGMDRGLFQVELGGWDHHGRLNEILPQKLQVIDDGIGDLASELKRQGLFDNVAIVIRSEFGRTHRVNSGAGTDHGHNGNYFVAGGSVRGGQVLGKFPKMRDHTPSHPWESIYKGLFEWLGVEPEQHDHVIPLHGNFDNLYSQEDLFES